MYDASAHAIWMLKMSATHTTTTGLDCAIVCECIRHVNLSGGPHVTNIMFDAIMFQNIAATSHGANSAFLITSLS